MTTTNISPAFYARRGFTLIELLVVIAIIGVLVGLLLPAVQQAREAARRTNCVNKMKQLALACHNYKDVNGTLPPGWQKPTDLTNFPQGNYWGWGALILPFVEEGSLFDRIDFTYEYTVNSSPNDGISATVLDGYLCPSDGSGPMGIQFVNHAKSNYIGSFGNKIIDSANWSTAANRGVFTENSSLKFRQITDGTSKTILLGERTGTPRAGNPQPYKAGLWAGPRALSLTPKHPYLAVGRGPGASTDIGNTVNGSNPWTLSASDHPGGCNVAKVDGSVAFLNDSITINAYRWMIEINDGQVIPD